MKIKLLGDPHLGRTFVHGVPLHHRGKRETMVWNQFADSVQLTKKFDLHICMGDLFDKAVVPYHVIRRAAETYMHAAEDSSCTFVILKGNHDWMRDLTQPSAFDIFAKIVAPVKNIVIVDTYKIIDDMIFFAWHPTMTPQQMLEGKVTPFPLPTAYGHWDLDSYGGPDINLIPYQFLQSLGVKDVYNGHIHKSQEFTRAGIAVHVVGSMQPYAHGEESDESLYLTRKAGELGDYEAYRDKYLRIVMSATDQLADLPDALQLVIKREGQAEVQKLDVDLGTFDVEAMFLKAFEANKVSKETTEKLLAHFQTKRLTDGA